MIRQYKLYNIFCLTSGYIAHGSFIVIFDLEVLLIISSSLYKKFVYHPKIILTCSCDDVGDNDHDEDENDDYHDNNDDDDYSDDDDDDDD